MLFKVLVSLSLISLSLSGASALPTVLRRRCLANPAPASSAQASPAASAAGVEAAPTTASSAMSSAAKPAPSSTSKPKPSAHSSAPAPASSSGPSSGCFPSAGFNMPDSPPSSTDNWWCSRESEYAFMGFSYAVNACPSQSSMTNDFKNMKSQFGARYVRIYAACDRDGFYDDVVDAAWDAGVGVFSLVWFGFDGGNEWQGRLSALEGTIMNNAKAPFVIRNLAVGSEPMFDNVLPIDQLVSTIQSVQGKVSQFGIQVSLSDMAYLFAQNPSVLAAVAHIESNTLPFFASDATTGDKAWHNVQSDLNTYTSKAPSKKIYLTQTGWPSNTDVWPANTPSAVASVSSEKAYFDLLDSMCSTFKALPQGGGGWFAHIYNDEDLPGWGVMQNGQPKFDFSARSHC